MTVAASVRRHPDRSTAPSLPLPEFLAPRSLTTVRELAQLIARAEWAPDTYRDGDGNYSVAKLELAIMQGAAVGLGPIAAVQSIALIDGKPAIWGDGALAVIAHSGLLDDMTEEYVTDDEEGLTAISTLRRRHRPTPIVGRFSLAMAEQAQLTQKEGPWRSYPRRMLMMRARSWALRDGFADVLRGLAIREEVEELVSSNHPRTIVSASAGEDDIRSRSWSPRPRFAVPHCAHQPAAEAPESVAVAAPAPDLTRCDQAADDRVTPEQEQLHGSDDAATAEDVAYTLIDPEGVAIEVIGPTALRIAFADFFDRHLAPGQILGIWESNEGARAAIAQAFGDAALVELSERVAKARDVYENRKQQRPPTFRPSKRSGHDGRGRARRPMSPDDFQLPIGPGWPEARIFRVYRRRLRALQTGGPGTATAIASFREVNAPTEMQLRNHVPHLMGEIDAIYRWAATHAR